MANISELNSSCIVSRNYYMDLVFDGKSQSIILQRSITQSINQSINNNYIKKMHSLSHRGQPYLK